MKHNAYKFILNIDGYGDENGRKIVIDPIESNSYELDLIYINDIRENILVSVATKKDKEKQNAKFFIANVMEWPTVFVITTKDIDTNKEVLIDYGEGYTETIWEERLNQRMMNHKRDKCNEILDKTVGDLRKKKPNIYQLE